MIEKNCKVCHRLFKGNRKKQFCNDLCRVRWHRQSKWVNINNLTKEQVERFEEKKRAC